VGQIPVTATPLSASQFCGSLAFQGDGMMDSERQRQEVDRNYDAFVRVLGSILPQHRDQLALMRDGCIIGYFDTPKQALQAATELFPDGIFSLQEVTDEPLDLGFWSHVGH
jgi:hypothetical protein